MKRYLAPILVLALLFAAGGSLWSFCRPAPAAEQPSQAVTEELPAATTPAEAPDNDRPSGSEPIAAEDAAAETSPAESIPADEIPSDSPPVPLAPLPSFAPESAEKTTQTEATPAKPEPMPNAPQTPTSPAEPEQPAEAPAADLSVLAQELLDEINSERANTAVPPLTLDTALSSVAQLRAEECTVSFGHTRPDGTRYLTAVQSAGISYLYLGENLAAGHTTAQAVIHDWIASDGHHDNLVNAEFTRIGIGIVKNTSGRYQGAYTWVTLFKD